MWAWSGYWLPCWWLGLRLPNAHSVAGRVALDRGLVSPVLAPSGTKVSNARLASSSACANYLLPVKSALCRATSAFGSFRLSASR